MSPSKLAKQKLAMAICDFLSENIGDGTIPSDNSEGIEVAMQCIAEAFGIDLDDKDQRNALSIKPAMLSSVFDVFVATQQKMDDAGNKQTAAELKDQGNKLMAAKDFDAAIEKYSSAIKLDGTNAVYYANRAAAYSQNNDHESAADDARKAIKIDPKYSKGYSRLGHALFCLGMYEDAVKAYENGLKMEPGNASMMQALKTAASKCEKPVATAPSQASRDAASPFGAGGGMPGAGGFDIASLMSNPEMMNMAQKMMSNPQFATMAQNLMKDPGALGNILGQNPELAKLAEQFGKKN